MNSSLIRFLPGIAVSSMLFLASCSSPKVDSSKEECFRNMTALHFIALENETRQKEGTKARRENLGDMDYAPFTLSNGPKCPNRPDEHTGIRMPDKEWILQNNKRPSLEVHLARNAVPPRLIVTLTNCSNTPIVGWDEGNYWAWHAISLEFEDKKGKKHFTVGRKSREWTAHVASFRILERKESLDLFCDLSDGTWELPANIDVADSSYSVRAVYESRYKDSPSLLRFSWETARKGPAPVLFFGIAQSSKE